MFVKAGWGLAGGVLLLLTIFGQRVFPVGGSTAAGIGVLYGARGIGAGLGPIALRWILGQTAGGAAADDRPGLLHRRRLLHGAGLRADAAARRAVRAAARTSAGRFSGCSARCCCSWRCRIAFAAACSPRSSRSSRSCRPLSSYWTAYAARSGRLVAATMSFVLGAMFCVPGVLWLLIQSRWRTVDSSSRRPCSRSGGRGSARRPNPRR